VWGIQLPVNTSATLTDGNLTMKVTGSRVVPLGTACNPFTITNVDRHADDQWPHL